MLPPATESREKVGGLPFARGPRLKACVWAWSGQLEFPAWDLEIKLVSYDKGWVGTAMTPAAEEALLVPPASQTAHTA